MILLTKENDLLNSLIGKSFNQKSKFEAEKILSEIHTKAQSRFIGKSALCFVLDKKEIMGLGGSTLMKDKDGKIFSNLILDQLGLFLAGMFQGTGGIVTVSLIDTAGGSRTINVINQPTLWNFSTGASMFHQIGSGSTSPTRQDFQIETAFGTAPEDAIIAPANPVYNSGLGSFKSISSTSAGGSGTIRESVMISRWRDGGNTNRFFALFRDIITPAVSFIAGQTIALEYTVQL